MLEDSGYKEVEDEEEALEVEENPGLAKVHGVGGWHMCSLLERGYTLFQEWLVDNRILWVYHHFAGYLVA